MKFLVPVDLTQNELRNAVAQNLTSGPGSPKVGQLYFDTTLGSGYFWNGTSYAPTDATKATGIPNTALATNPLNRANHFGTQTSSTISDLATVVKAYTLDSFAAPVANVPFNAKNITNLADPINPQDASTKNYVDVNLQSAAAGIDSKPAVAVVSTTNVATMSGLPTVDGITLTAGQRVLLVAQTTQNQNGPWIVASGAWTRPSGDASPNGELALGAFWFVEQGTSFASSQWRLATPTSGAITPGTTSITITQFGAPITYTASNGINLTGLAFTGVATPAGGLIVSASGFAIDTTLTARKYSTALGDGTSTSYTITHNLGTADVIAGFRDTAGNAVQADYQAGTTNTITVTFSVAPATNAYRVTVIG